PVRPGLPLRQASAAVGARVARVEKRERGTGNREQGTGNREQGTGNREQGTGNREQGTGNREQGTGNGSARLLPAYCPRAGFKTGRFGQDSFAVQFPVPRSPFPLFQALARSRAPTAPQAGPGRR